MAQTPEANWVSIPYFMPRFPRHVKKSWMRLPPLSLEALIGLFAGLLVGLVEMNWELRGLGVISTAGLAIHIAKQLDIGLARQIAFALGSICILLSGTWHPIWISFHEDFPTVTGEEALSRIIVFCTLAACGIAGYVFLIRPRGKEGYRVLPAQLIAFGACVMAVGLFAVMAGLGWQFKQNWASGVTPTGAPVLIQPALPVPQVTQRSPSPALPPPPQRIPSAVETAPQLFSGYDLTPNGIRVLADELYKIKDALPSTVDLQRTFSEGSSGPLTSSIFRACDRAGINCPTNNGRPNSPSESGAMIYVADPKTPPASAMKLQSILEHVGIHAPFVSRQGVGPNSFILFIGPTP